MRVARILTVALVPLAFTAGWLLQGRRGPVPAPAASGASRQGARTGAALPHFVASAAPGETPVASPRPPRLRFARGPLGAEAGARAARAWRETGDDDDIPVLAPELAAPQRVLREKVEALAAHQPGLHVAFSDCTGGACVARVVGSDPAALEAFAAEARDSHLAPEVRVRERLTASNGRLYEADVTHDL